MNEMKG